MDLGLPRRPGRRDLRAEREPGRDLRLGALPPGHDHRRRRGARRGARASLVIVPPGISRSPSPRRGARGLGFTSLATDLLALCPNNAEYIPSLDNIAPVTAWPESPHGYQLRVYDLTAPPAGKPRCYRHRTAMTNFGGRRGPSRATCLRSARTPTTTSRQASLIHAGTFIHHMRRAWGRDARE